MITRRLTEQSPFKLFLQAHGAEVSGDSFIQVQPLPFKYKPKPNEWIFFSSKNGVRCFFEKVKPTHAKLAAVSGGTAREIEKHGCRVDFTGSRGNLQKTAVDFLKISENSPVTFAVAKNGNRTIQQEIEKHREIEELHVYETSVLSKKVHAPLDTLVFTSPSNVRGYLQQNNISPEQKIVSIGESTAAFLKQQGIFNFVTSQGYSEWALADAAIALIYGDTSD